jgi:outer membrane protein assembly factor BamA
MRRIKHIVLVVCLLIPGVSALGQSNVSLTFVGVDDGAKSFFKEFIEPTEFNDAVEAKQYLRNWVSTMHGNGWLSASIDTIIYDSSSIQAWLYLGKTYKLVELSTNEVASNWLYETGIHPSFLTNKPLQPADYQKVISKLLKYGENNGYPFANVQLDSIDLSTDGAIKAKLTVNENRYFEFDTISIVGDAKISKQYLYQYLGISPEQPYSEKLVLKIRDKISKLPFVTVYANSRIYFSGNLVRITLYLKHRRTDQADGIIGFAPNTSSSQNNLLITGEVNLSLQNLVKRGIEYDLHWKSFAARSQQLKMAASVPYIARTPIGIDGNFEYVKFDTQFFTLRTKLGFRYLFEGTDYVKLYVQNAQSALISVDTSTIRTTKTIPISNPVRTTSYGLQAQRQKLDNPLNPRKGFQILLDGNVGSRNVLKDLRIDRVLFTNSANETYSVYDSADLKSIQAEFSYDASVFIPIGKKSTAVGIIQGKQLLTPNVFVNDLYRYGGTRSLRGFNEESILANGYTIFGIEYRYLLGENAFFQLFANAAYTENKSDPEKGLLTDTPFGFGAGVHLDVNSGILSLAYALGSEQGNGIKFNQAKIHFGIINYL